MNWSIYDFTECNNSQLTNQIKKEIKSKKGLIVYPNQDSIFHNLLFLVKSYPLQLKNKCGGNFNSNVPCVGWTIIASHLILNRKV